MPALYTLPREKPLPSFIDGTRYGHARIIDVAKDLIGAPTVSDGILSDCTDVTAAVTNIRGYAVRLRKTQGARYDLIQIPKVGLTANLCFGGIYVEWGCPDSQVLFPAIAGMRDVGVWMEGAAGTIKGGHVYGCCDAAVRFGGHKMSGPGNIAEGARFNDSRRCIDILVGTNLTGCHSHNGFEHNIFVDAKASISNTEILVRPADKVWPNPIGIEFTEKANHSHDDGSMDIGAGSTGILLGANDCNIRREVCCIDGATALHIVKPVFGNKVKFDISVNADKPGIVQIDDLGAANKLVFKGQVIVNAPERACKDNQIWVNGERKAA